MKILWLENWRRAVRYNKWLHIDFVKEIAKHTDLCLYGPRLEEYFPDLVPLLYEEKMPFKEIVKILGIDVIVMHSKDAVFTDYKPKSLFGDVKNECWLAEDFAKVNVPKVCLEVDYHYEQDDKWYQKMGIDLILQRHYSQSLRQQTIPMKWLPFSIDPNVFKTDPAKVRIGGMCFAGVLGSKETGTYHTRKKAALILLKHNLIDIFSHFEKVGDKYISCLQEYVSHLSGASKYDLCPGKNFEIMSSGSALLTNKFSGLDKLFPDGSYCLYKNDGSDVVEKAKRIVGDSDYRNEIVQKGRKCILEKHTYDIRVKELLSILEKLSRGEITDICPVKKNNLHFCCGDVYLEGYTNIDGKGKLVSDVKDNPNITTLEKYYKYPFGTEPKEVIADKIMNLTEDDGWKDFKTNSIDTIVMLCAIEHFTKGEAENIIGQFHRMLKPDGKLIIDFPDINQIIKKYKGDPEFMIRLIYGSQKNEYAFHKWGWTKETFAKLLSNYWKTIKWKTVVPHDYPEVEVVATDSNKMTKVCFIYDSEPRDEILKTFSRFTPKKSGIWKDMVGVTSVDEADYCMLLDGRSSEIVPPEKAILVGAHPKMEGFASYQCFDNRQCVAKLDCRDTFGYGGWWLDEDYDTLSALKHPKKVKDLSCILSNGKGPWGEIQRIEFMKRFCSKYPGKVDLYGRIKPEGSLVADYKGELGTNTPATYRFGKRRGLEPYRYSIEFDNGPTRNYFSERFFDSMLMWCMPLYWGGTNVEDFLPADSFRYIDINGDGSDVMDIVNSNFREKHLDAIAEARDLLLNKYQIWPRLHSVIKEIK